MRKFKKIIAIALSAALSLSMTSLPVFAAATGSGSKTDSELKKTSIEKAFDGHFSQHQVLQLQMLKTVHSTRRR